ncbi:MAG: threonylcarbamoyl-AMP synthase [Bacteroidia bacterium]|nr:MAG: threonylcarbamoyl-AMP synthase [Bacteroidia bacterium]
MLVKIYPNNPDLRQIAKVVDVLERGGVIIYPTDTIYGIGCDINSARAAEKIAKMKEIQLSKANFSFIFYDLSHVSDYVKLNETSKFKLIRKNLPGAFTFVLPASSNMPKIFKGKKKTVGIRVPDNTIIRTIVKELGRPILNTSVHDDDEVIEYTTDPELIYEKYRDVVDLVIDGGYGKNVPSTIVDCTGDEPELIRQGIGVLQ